jgi:hypothetical protein
MTPLNLGAGMITPILGCLHYKQSSWQRGSSRDYRCNSRSGNLFIGWIHPPTADMIRRTLDSDRILRSPCDMLESNGSGCRPPQGRLSLPIVHRSWDPPTCFRASSVTVIPSNKVSWSSSRCARADRIAFTSSLGIGVISSSLER